MDNVDSAEEDVPKFLELIEIPLRCIEECEHEEIQETTPSSSETIIWQQWVRGLKNMMHRTEYCQYHRNVCDNWIFVTHLCQGG